MSLWRRTRSEVAGAWRSLRYDLDHRPGVPPGPGFAPGTARVADPDEVTSAGMDTFGIGWAGHTYAEPAAAPRRTPRRGVAVAAFAVLSMAGAGGSYAAVVTGLETLLAPEQPVAAGVQPHRAATGGTGRGGAEAISGMGRVPATGTPRLPAPGTSAPPAVAVPEPRVTTTTVTVRPTATATPPPVAPGPGDAEPTGCGPCDAPPVPTPTSAPSEPSESPSGTPPEPPMPTDTSAPAPTGSAPDPYESPAQ